MQWYFQVVPEDNWDMDSPYESTLVDLVINGEVRQVLIHTSKIGWGVVLDRSDGQVHSLVQDRLRQPHYWLVGGGAPDLQPRSDTDIGGC